MTEQKFPNTFAPYFRNKEFTLGEIRTGIKLGFLKLNQVPPEILKLVFPDDAPDKEKTELV